MLERVWRKGNPLTLFVGMQTSTATILIPKRSALEKVNCAPPVFNPNVFHCQQALPNMPMPQPQPQPPPQFIPTGENGAGPCKLSGVVNEYSLHQLSKNFYVRMVNGYFD